MSWSWSHTTQAYLQAQENLELRPLPKLQEIWAEWLAFDAGVIKEKQAIRDWHLDYEHNEKEKILNDPDLKTPAERKACLAELRQSTQADIDRELKNYHPSTSMDAFDADVYKKELRRIRKEHRDFIHTVTLSSPYGRSGYTSDPRVAMRNAKRDAINSLRRSLAESIWPRMEELATCTNGGWEAYCCPYGCGPHMVTFSSADELREEGLEKARVAKRRAKQNEQKS